MIKKPDELRETLGTPMAIRIQASHDLGWKVQRLGGAGSDSHNTPLASGDLKNEAYDIVRPSRKREELDRNDLVIKLIVLFNNLGYFVPFEFISDVILTDGGGAPAGTLKNACRTVNVNSMSGEIPKLDGADFAVLAEGSSISDTTPTIGTVEWSVAKAGVMYKASDELLADSGVDLAFWLGQSANAANNRWIEEMIVGGTTSDYNGILKSGSGINTYTAASSSALAAVDIFGAFMNNSGQYRGDGNKWLMTSEIASIISTLASTAAGLHSVDSLRDEPTRYLTGRDVITCDVSGTGLGTATSTGTTVAITADFNGGCYVFSRLGFTVKRSTEAYFSTGQIAYLYETRNGCNVANPNAVTALNMA